MSDRGGGIPAADLERIFEPFVTTKKHGMGLGLSVCRTIVLAHGGKLWAENHAGEGATFRFTLPSRRARRVSGATPTVFVVDDDPSVLKGVKRLLRSAGFTAETFASAQDFLARHDREAAGCVILDLAMPGIDGLRMQQTLTEQGSVLPIIFLTGHGDVPTSVQAMKRGAVDFLTKPVGDDELLGAVRGAIERCEVLRQARREIVEFERRLATLTPREREVLEHLLSGKLNKQIAADLGTVEQTIKVHRARVMQKMQVQRSLSWSGLPSGPGMTPSTGGT